MYKILGIDNKEYGPVSAEQVRTWIAEGRLIRTSQELFFVALEFLWLLQSLPLPLFIHTRIFLLRPKSSILHFVALEHERFD
jgi:hypothetical protein